MNQEEIQKASSTAFLFVPMDLEGTGNAEEYDHFQKDLETSGFWILEDDQDKNRYIYRYITDKMDVSRKEECLYLHYHLREEECRKRAWGTDGCVYRIPSADIRFRISAVHLFAFRTRVSIAAVQVIFEKNDPKHVATGLYYLKKLQRVKLLRDTDEEENEQAETLFDAVKGLFHSQMTGKLRFFPYLNEGTERANTMSLAYAVDGNDEKEDLYFLKNAYRTKGFVYNSNLDTEDENLFISDDYIWGITGENLACIILKRSEHIQNRFCHRFQDEYLLTYILLLHRKFYLYKILTDFGIGEQNDLQTLKAYQKCLNSYQTDYAYERITEVPQYHRLYKKLEEKMELAELFADVMEPVSELSSLRMEKAEADRSEQDEKMEKALAGLSFLAVFSALIDCSDYLEVVAGDMDILLAKPWSVQLLAGVQTVFSVGIAAVAIWALRGLLKRRKQ